MCKNIKCPSCSSVLAVANNGKLAFQQMKSISMVEVNMDDLTIDAKCHTCHNWSSIDSQNNITLNYKRKSQDVLFASTNQKK